MRLMLQASSHATDMPESRAQEMSAWRLRYALMLTDSLSSILFDARRNTCHCLLLNYWVRCGGLQVGRLTRPTGAPQLAVSVIWHQLYGVAITQQNWLLSTSPIKPTK